MNDGLVVWERGTLLQGVHHLGGLTRPFPNFQNEICGVRAELPFYWPGVAVEPDKFTAGTVSRHFTNLKTKSMNI